MNIIEPLQYLLKIYKDKNEILFSYLPEKTIEKITNCYFLDEEHETLYLDEMIYFVNKSTGLFEKKGKTIKITDTSITIRIQNKYNMIFLKDEYYIFKKIKKRKNKKNIYESLLNNL